MFEQIVAHEQQGRLSALWSSGANQRRLDFVRERLRAVEARELPKQVHLDANGYERAGQCDQRHHIASEANMYGLERDAQCGVGLGASARSRRACHQPIPSNPVGLGGW